MKVSNGRRFLFTLCVLPLALSGCIAPKVDLSGQNNADFAKSVFQLLVDGNQGAAEHIDWQIFRSGTVNYGQQHMAAKDEPTRIGMQKGFIFGFKNGFSRTGANMSMLSNWGQTSEDASWVTITADTQRSTKLILTLSKRENKRRLAAIDFQYIPQAPRNGFSTPYTPQ